ncbi:transport acessory protein MmpS [Mycobacterium heckeshornense]|uniref:Putative membrane protein, MmpS n=1 Tax=Mycobacterium heckeshornense TaxID=110505 RepID=A0A2G8BGU3_9MYCO|nr:MmpS family transport accessory protein [Mycobacterium heckeshornense]KMV23401.1 membrane protein [Mycobacterium heckeshornense]MCV7032751.1 transport acessory protein MmpS [Mycobacterium heckeshornense]PIJ36856.1 transport acessory protein MmpS [Mycobacterium heckeshornense]BCO35388.1 putative membrane protein, MmpS [Mycobacterium heckeshornense]
MLRFLTRAWVPLIVVVAVVLGGVAVIRLRGIFGSEQIFSATGRSAEPLAPAHRKRVTYEVYGPDATTGHVSYLNDHVRPERTNFTSLPWTYTLVTTAPAVIANVVAQGDSDAIGCRITVDGEVKDVQSSAGHHAQVSCLVKAA